MKRLDVTQIKTQCQLLTIDPRRAHYRAIHWNGRGAKPLPPPPGGHKGEELERLQQDGYRLYLIPGGGQRREDVTAQPAVFAEWDGMPPDEVEGWLHELQVQGLPEPTLTLATWEHGSLHAYWRLEQPCTDIPRWERLMRRFVVVLGADPACTDPSRCMRLAGSSYIAKQGHPKAGQVLGQARIRFQNPDATSSIEELEQWVEGELQRRPGLQELERQESQATDTPPSDEERRQRRGGNPLPPRPVEQIEEALAAIPRRGAPGPNGERTGGPYAWPYHRLVLCGLRDALYRLYSQGLDTEAAHDPDAAHKAHQGAARLMEAHSPSRECGWDVAQVLASSRWLDEGCFWMRAREAGWEAPKAEGTAAGDRPSEEPSCRGPIPLGYDRDLFLYQRPGSGQIVQLTRSQHNATGLAGLAPWEWWQRCFPLKGGDESGPPRGVNWAAAACALMEQQDRVGPFDPHRLRGRGVWLDQGRVVWHQGSRLVVDGQLQPLHGIDSRLIYTPAPDVVGEAQPEPLDDATGRQVLEILQCTGWHRPIEGAYLAGAAVLGPVGGALSRRPVLMVTARRGSGKSEAVLRPVSGLWGGPGLHLHSSAPTEAFIRQTLGADTLPVTVDEWEKVAGRKTGSSSSGFLELLRVNYDGTSTGRGTAHGKALRQGCRALFVLAGINVSHEDAALHSRTVLIRKRWLPAEQWQQVEPELRRLTTPVLGRRLVARTVANLHTLLHNIAVLHQVIVTRLQGTETNRLADVQAHFLAGALLLTSTRRLQGPEDAQEWLDHLGWSPDGSGGPDTPDGGDEGQLTLAHLLAHSIRWQASEDDPSGTITVRELVALAAGRDEATSRALGYGAAPHSAASPTAASKVLGRHGLKVEDGFLLVANSGPEIGQVFAGTRWADGGHRARLLDLEGADPLGRPVRFPSGPSCRAVQLPLASVLPQGHGP